MLYDFIDGSLACLNAENAVAQTLDFINKAEDAEDETTDDEIAGTYPLLFVLDHHPADHCSFTENGGIWPVHCVEGTRGAEIHDSLKPFVCEELCFYKGCDKTCEQYSGSEGKSESGQTLTEVLDLLDIKNVYVCGIATEFCVKNTCMDLLKEGFKVSLLKDCLAHVDAEGHKKAMEEMRLAGISII